MDEAGHDADLALIRSDDAGAIGADETNVTPPEGALDLDHVIHRYAFCDANDQPDTGVGGFENRIRGKWRRDEDQRRIAVRLRDSVAHAVEHRDPLDLLSRLPRRHARDDLRSVSLALRGMERSFLSGDALHDDARIFIDQNAHGVPRFCALADE